MRMIAATLALCLSAGGASAAGTAHREASVTRIVAAVVGLALAASSNVVLAGPGKNDSGKGRDGVARESRFNQNEARGGRFAGERALRVGSLAVAVGERSLDAASAAVVRRRGMGTPDFLREEPQLVSFGEKAWPKGCSRPGRGARTG